MSFIFVLIQYPMGLRTCAMRRTFASMVAGTVLCLISLAAVTCGGCAGSSRTGGVRYGDSNEVWVHGPREFQIFLRDASGRIFSPDSFGIQRGSVVHATVRGQKLRLVEGSHGFAEYGDSIEVSVVSYAGKYVHLIIPPTDPKQGDSAEKYYVDVEPDEVEFYDGLRRRAAYISRSSYMHVTPSLESTPDRMRHLFDSLGLRRLTGSEMDLLGIVRWETVEDEDGGQHYRMIHLKDGDAGPIIVALKRGGAFDRLNSSELRALRSSPLIAAAGPFVDFQRGLLRRYSNCLILNYRGSKPFTELERLLLSNGFRILETQIDSTQGGDNTYGFRVVTDGGIGAGLWEVVDWLSYYLGFDVGLCDLDWRYLNDPNIEYPDEPNW